MPWKSRSSITGPRGNIMFKLSREMKKALTATGLPFEMINKSKHVQIMLAGECAGVISKSSKTADGLNVFQSIKRIAERNKPK